jgi:hypothetical protein
MIQGADVNEPVNNQFSGTRALRQKLVRMAALVILVGHQAGAGVVCLCRNELVAQHAMTQTAQRSASPTKHSCRAEAADLEAARRSEEPAVPAEQQSRMPTAFIAQCCQVHAQADYQAASAARPLPIPTFAQLTPALAGNACKPALRPVRDHRPGRARPLYLTQSCYLI